MPTIDFAVANPFGVSLVALRKVKENDNVIDWHRRAYGEIALALREIIDRNSSTDRTDSHQLSPPASGVNHEYNNIIAISGDRGTGKSSVMHTVLSHLVEAKGSQGSSWNASDLDDLAQDAKEKSRRNTTQRLSLAECQFFSLPPIDPTKFPKNESLIGHVVANIYKQIMAFVDGKGRSVEPTCLDDILELCDKVLEALRIRTLGVDASMRDNPDDLDMLDKLANTSNLRACLIDLIREYLLLQTPKRCDAVDATTRLQNHYLVISIDDLDTNIDRGYGMAEEIRNFFFIPHVIILMAVKIEQLTDVVQQHYLGAFARMLEPRGVLDAQPDEMATKYIQKLIPDQRRIHLPSLLAHSVRSIMVKTKALVLDGKKQTDLVEYFFLLVWKKSGILLVKNSHDSHGLIPMNLRGLHQVLSLMEDMPDVDCFKVDDGGLNRTNLHNNLRRLEAWIVDSVSSNAVPRELALTFRRMAGHPSTGLNGFVVRQLREYVTSSDNASLFGNDSVASELLDVRTQPQNISLGDILYLLDKVDEYNSSAGHMHYTASIRMLYSIRLTAAFYPLVSRSTKPQPEYRTILEGILSGLIYNPEVKLTLSHREWMPNRNTTLAVLQGIKGGMDLRGAPIGQMNDSSVSMSLKDAVWLSFFVVQYGPRLRRGLPSSHREGAYVTSCFASESDAFSGYISVNWLAFVHNALCPEETVRRLLGYSFLNKAGATPSSRKGGSINVFDLLKDGCFPADAIKEASILLEQIIRWRNKHLAALPLNCVDVINGLVNTLERNRWRPNGDDMLVNRNEFFKLSQCVRADLVELLAPVVKSASDRNKFIQAFEECPLLDEVCWDVQKAPKPSVHRGQENQPEVKSKFDWILFS